MPCSKIAFIYGKGARLYIHSDRSFSVHYKFKNITNHKNIIEVTKMLIYINHKNITKGKSLSQVVLSNSLFYLIIIMDISRLLDITNHTFKVTSHFLSLPFFMTNCKQKITSHELDMITICWSDGHSIHANVQ